MENGGLPSAKHTKNHGKLLFILDFPMKNGGSFGSFHSFWYVYHGVITKLEVSSNYTMQ